MVMKAALLTEPFHISIHELPDPILDSENNVLVKVLATGVCGSDIHAYRGEHKLRKPPVVLGHEIAGEVIEIGPNATGVKIGDRVAIEPQLTCGACSECKLGYYNLCGNKKLLGGNGWFGGFGEYVTVPDKLCYKLVDGLAMHHASLAEPLAVGIHAVRSLGNSDPAQRILIVGAGPIGLLVAMAAQAEGMKNIAVSDTKKFNVEASLKLSLPFGIQVGEEPMRKTFSNVTGWEQADVAFVAAGGQGGIGGALASVGTRGKIVVLAHYGGLTPTDLMDVQARELNIFGSKMYTSSDFKRAVEILNQAEFPCDTIITHRLLGLEELPSMVKELNDNPEGVIKAVLEF